MNSSRISISSAADRRACEREEDFLIARFSRAEPIRVLEVGPGAGRITRHLVSLCEELVVCDVSAENLDRLTKQLATNRKANLSPRQLAIVDLAELPEYGRFDAALAIRVLPLVDDWERAVWTLCDAVRPGGLVAFDLLCQQSWPGFASRLVRPRRPPGRLIARIEIDAVIRGLPLAKLETLSWGYPRWACFDADVWLGTLFPRFAFGTLFVGERIGASIDK